MSHSFVLIPITFLILNSYIPFYFRMLRLHFIFVFFFFNDTATTEFSPLPLHAALPISDVRTTCEIPAGSTVGRCDQGHKCSPAGSICRLATNSCNATDRCCSGTVQQVVTNCVQRSEEHTSELQSPCNLVCRLLLEKIMT